MPSELEWEKAARGIDGRRFPWGNQWDRKRCRNFELVTGKAYSDPVEWVSTLAEWPESHDEVREGPVAVGSYPAGASPYGCVDTAGNVSEWCADWYDALAYQRYVKGDLAPPASGTSKVVRGFDWRFHIPWIFRVTRRAGHRPSALSTDTGFRYVRGLL